MVNGYKKVIENIFVSVHGDTATKKVLLCVFARNIQFQKGLARRRKDAENKEIIHCCNSVLPA
jgi:hypothetical protein